ncbi:hypothetical protein GCM10011571_17000 [Marinithermofilum abyssi]|uniref:Uncharacterized protein n=1 Tax=Marinithermofilum abyssi TaxID=1571185 RepID=A0A8J2VHF6_9BACL|nr:hypothetical protein GCM10011571_17000 [Marinithermofilum abyssi]
MYLTEKDVKALLHRLTDHFSNGQIAFDAFNRLGMRLGKLSPIIKATGASFGGVDDPREIEKWNPRLKLVTELTPLEMPGIAKLPWKYRVLSLMLNLNRSLRRLNRLLRYQF